MTKIFLIIAFLASVLSCSKEFGPSSNAEDKPVVHRMSVSTGSPTKTVIEEVTAGEQYQVLWQSGDAIGVFEVTSGSVIAAQKTVSDQLDEGENRTSASFNFSFEGSASGPFKYSFVYPDEALTQKGSKYYINLPSNQRFGDGSFDPEADILISEQVVAESVRPSSVNVAFARIGATAKMLVKAPDDTSEKLRRITFSSTEGYLAGGYELNPVTGELQIIEEGSNSIVLTPANAMDYSGNFTVWFRLAAVTLTNNFTVKIETDTKTYTKTVNLGARTLQFTNGSLTDFTVDMGSISGVNSWDVINVGFTGATNTTYVRYTKKGSYSNAIYDGLSNKDSGYPQYFRLTKGDNQSGLVTTKSGGYVQAVRVDLPSYSSERKLFIYASNTAYSEYSDMSDENKTGALIATIKTKTDQNVSETIWFDEAYQYVGFCTSGSTLINQICIKWEDYPPQSESGGTSYDVSGWLEIPDYSKESLAGTTTSSREDLYRVTHTALMNSTIQRNYTLLYDPEMFASYWVAYPLCHDHTGSGRTESWAYDPSVPSGKQTKITKGAYGVTFTGVKYSENYYARGHQIPNADRSGVDPMMAQTYYATNLTPQMQNGFNAHAWAGLEAAVRGAIPSGDTLYVVTGAAFRKKGGSEPINTIVSKRDGKTLPVPNYYWKALLKVHRNPSGAVTSAKTIGYWMEHHDNYVSSDWEAKNVSVDQLETWTGLDLFHLLPDDIESSAESNTSWSTFTSF